MTTNIFMLGSPGVGKSTLSHGLVYTLGTQGISCAFVEESARRLTWREAYKQLDNQLYVSALYWEDIQSLQGKVDVLVSDSHLLVGLVYSSPLYRNAMDLVSLYDSIRQNSISVVVRPVVELEKDYDSSGRNHDYKASMELWDRVQEEVIPLLDFDKTIYVDRSVSLKELGSKVMGLLDPLLSLPSVFV